MSFIGLKGLKNKIPPAFVGGILCIVLARINLFSLFYLLPIAYVVYASEESWLWPYLFRIVLANIALSILGYFIFSGSLFILLFNAIYISLSIILFSWILKPSYKGPSFLRIRTLYRLLLSAILQSLILIPLYMIAERYSNITELIQNQVDQVIQLYTEAASTDVVQQTLVQEYLHPDTLLELMGASLLRGAAVIAHVIIFYISMSLGSFIARLRGRYIPRFFITEFKTDSWFIWLLSLSLAAILLGVYSELDLLEIPGWNIFILGCVVYLVQGLGIILYFFKKPGMPLIIRLIVLPVLFLLFFSPGINLFASAVCILLGIAEHWLPLRRPYNNGSSSTPGM